MRCASCCVRDVAPAVKCRMKKLYAILPVSGSRARGEGFPGRFIATARPSIRTGRRKLNMLIVQHDHFSCQGEDSPGRSTPGSRAREASPMGAIPWRSPASGTWDDSSVEVDSVQIRKTWRSATRFFDPRQNLQPETTAWCAALVHRECGSANRSQNVRGRRFIGVPRGKSILWTIGGVWHTGSIEAGGLIGSTSQEKAVSPGIFGSSQEKAVNPGIFGSGFDL